MGCNKTIQTLYLRYKFKIITDHKPLVWLFNLKEPNSKLLRWKIKLQEFDYTVEYKKEKLNTNADALSRIKINNFEIIEKEGNLLEINDNIALCISVDRKLGSGIAADINSKFKSREYLLNFKQPKITDILMQRLPNGKALFHLVTKEKFNQKPSYKNFRETLKYLIQYLISNNIDNISIPKIGCGKDKLSWEKVKTILHEIFSDSNIKITVYLLSLSLL